MLRIPLVFRTIVALSVGMALVECAPARWHMQTASTRGGITTSDATSSPGIAAEHRVDTRGPIGTQATQPLGEDQEPESISGGTEP
ncbi:MAG TPA: hypothetical protein VE690_13645 [Rhodopila sp.]|nr:hypothetical protein [Rhodopila sp.]